MESLYVSLALKTLTQMPHMIRNIVRLRAYQREYAWRKQARRRKVGKAERALLEEQRVKKHQLLEMENLPVYTKVAASQCVCFLSHNSTLTHKSRAYVCSLIVRSQAVDRRRTQDMMQEEERAQEYFEEMKDILRLFCLSGWMDQFRERTQDFIQEQLGKAANIMAASGKDDEDIVRLHGLRRLVAGAVQEEELLQQPGYAFTYATLDSAIIWNGRGYVITHLLISCLTHLPRVNLRKFKKRYGW
jgi:hypothetical protein